MGDLDEHIRRVSSHYDRLAANGPYGVVAPRNRGGRKAQYVAAVFDAALMGALSRDAPYQCVLDYGCGTGLFTRAAARIATEVVGMDISAAVLQQAQSICRGLANVRLLQTNGSSITLPDRSVDVSIAREVLCYVPDAHLLSMLAELRRVTKPGGRFLWLDQASEDSYWQRHPNAPNLVKRSPNAIRKAAESSGWEVLGESVVRTPRFPWIYLVWSGLLPQRLIPALARWEVTLHSQSFKRRHPHRWWNGLFELRNPANG